MARRHKMLSSYGMAGILARFRDGFRRLGLCSLLFLIGLMGTNKAMAETIKVYTYHSHPPFVLAKGKGLTYDLADFLSERSGGRFSFEVSVLSRPHLNKIIKKRSAAVVPWVNPAWFGDKEEVKYTWAQGVLMPDGNAVVSSQTGGGFNYDGPSSVEGKVIGGLRGHRYAGIDDFIKDTGLAKRVDADTHNANIKKLRDGLIDLMLIPESATFFKIKTENLSSELYVSAIPHSRYERRLMVLHESLELKEFIEQFLVDMSSDGDWQKIIARYR